MKILYLSPHRIDRSLSPALSTAGAGVVLTSATRLDEAAHWIFNNLDLAALILDSDFGLPRCASFLRNLRSRGLSVPLILMASEEVGSMEALRLSADDCIRQKDVLLDDLEGTVRRVVYRARPSAAFAVLAGHVVDIHRQLERMDREHDLRIEIGDLRAAHTALQERLVRSEEALHEISARQTDASQNAARREQQLLCELREAEHTLQRERLTATEQIAQLAEHEARLIAELANATTIQDALDRQIAKQDAACASLEQELESKNEMLEQLLQRRDNEFDEHPLPLCRASRAGVITHANRAFGALLGCPFADAKRRLNLASELLDSSNELAWLVERSGSSGDTPSVECTRRKVDGLRLMLRLRAMPVQDGIHIVIEDLTMTWMLQERLHRAQQMEAVGRMAAEVALTCVNFLRSVAEHGCRLIAMLEDGTETRRAADHMIGEVDRVATSLRQLADYADDQAMGLDPVDLHQVLRDLEPILQELAGDDVEVVLPERPAREVPPFTVDVTAQRVERLLINLARFSRERIPSGGRIVFDVASATVDGQFLAKYPNVRPGPHVLLTVTQAKGADRLVESAGAQGSVEENEAGPSVFGASGVHLSALHGLVRHCGGHLCMDSDTTGEIIKIHLPLRAA